MTSVYSKTTLWPVSPKAKQPKAFVLYRHVGNQNTTRDLLYIIFSTISPAYMAYVCVIWCQKPMFICDYCCIDYKVIIDCNREANVRVSAI